MNQTTRNRLALVCAPLVLAAAALLGLHGCGEATPRQETRILVIDGIELTFDDVQPYADYLRSYRPDGGEKTIVMDVVNEYLLPLRVAQRAWPEQRAALYEQAAALRSVADNVHELEKQSSQMGDRVYRDKLYRNRAQLPVSQFVFDPALTGSVSPPLEVPQGWFVVGAFDLQRHPLAIGDYVDALQVGFVTHLGLEWKQWYAEQQAHLADKLTFVHPDYRDCLPDWIHPPKAQ